MLKERENVIVSAVEPTGANREKIWVQKSENMCNPNNKYTGAIATAGVGNMITYGTSEKTYTLKKCCKVQKGKAYAISWKPNTINTTGSRTIAVVNDNDITQYSTSYTNDSNSFIFTPTASGYLSISLDANATEVQVEGENATTYKPYVEPRIYVLNNNIYEELILSDVINLGSQITELMTKVQFTRYNQLQSTSFDDMMLKGESSIAKVFEGVASLPGFPVDAYAYGLLITINISKATADDYATTQIYIADNPGSGTASHGIYVRTRKTGNWAKLTTTIVKAHT